MSKPETTETVEVEEVTATPASITVDIPVSTGTKGTPDFAEDEFSLELPTLSDEGLAWIIANFKRDEIIEGFVKSYVIAKQAVARKELKPESGKAKKKGRGVFAQLNVK